MIVSSSSFYLHLQASFTQFVACIMCTEDSCFVLLLNYKEYNVLVHLNAQKMLGLEAFPESLIGWGFNVKTKKNMFSLHRNICCGSSEQLTKAVLRRDHMIVSCFI